jgi:hypothetical protein
MSSEKMMNGDEMTQPTTPAKPKLRLERERIRHLIVRTSVKTGLCPHTCTGCVVTTE